MKARVKSTNAEQRRKVGADWKVNLGTLRTGRPSLAPEAGIVPTEA